MKPYALMALLLAGAASAQQLPGAPVWLPPENFRQWSGVDALMRAHDGIKLTIGLTPTMATPLVKAALLPWVEKGRIEIASRINGDPILTLVTGHPAAPRPQDALERAVEARERLQKRLGLTPAGFIAGAGALGNEALKNLALLGVGRLFVCDTDTIETSNLTRSVLFRLHDVGRHKADVACERAMDMNPDVKAVPIHGDLRFALGLGLFRRADVILGCLDNIAARVYLSRQAYRMGKPSVDAGLDTLNGDVYTFSPPEGPCYECRLKEIDKKEFKRRQSCLKLARKDSGAGGKVPTAPTIAAIASGLQTQIAVRMI
ncbi:MAG: ThiF family adenylyltransferase, partial [Elusimicrobiota bacterium]